MPKKRATKKTKAAGGEADPRFEPVVAAFARTPGFSLMESKSRALRGLMANGKSFGMSSHGRLILKLTEQRVAALVAKGVGRPMRHGTRVTKGWIDVTKPKANWVALAKEAHALAVKREKKPAPAKKKR